jgi:arylsulfatase
MVSFTTSVRRHALAALIVASLVASCSQSQAHGPAKRVILITCDTLRADRLGTYGCALPTSPNVDAFARESVVFDKAYSTAPWTGPSLCALHTGKLPDELGVPGGNRFPLPAESITLAELARDAGYSTAAVVSNWVLRRPDPGRGDIGLSQGFQTFDDEMTVKEPNRDLYERVAPDTTRAAVRWLEEAKSSGNDRFFLWVHFQDPHGPYRPPAEFVKRFERPMTSEPSLPIGTTNKGKGQIPLYQAEHGETRPEDYRVRYDAEIAYFDASFGSLLAEIRKLGWLDDSLVVFTADHGESLGDHGYWFCHGENLYDEEVRVPLAIHFPQGAKHVAGAAKSGVASNGTASNGATNSGVTSTGTASTRGERVADLVSHLDLWPTIAEALGLRASENRGTSLFRETLPRDRVAVQTFGRIGFPNRWESIGDGRYRLVMSVGAAPELFDHESDPRELANLASKDPARAVELAKRMREYVENKKSAPLQELGPRATKGLKGLGYTDGEDSDEHAKDDARDKPGVRREQGAHDKPNAPDQDARDKPNAH